MELLSLLQGHLLDQIQWRHRELFNIHRVGGSRELEVWAVVTSDSSSRCHPAALPRPVVPTTPAQLHAPLARGDAHGPGPADRQHNLPTHLGAPGSSGSRDTTTGPPAILVALLAIAQEPGPSPGPLTWGWRVGGMGAHRPLGVQCPHPAPGTAAWPQHCRRGLSQAPPCHSCDGEQ